MSTPRAGWYLSESDTTLERWWDGSNWTGHTRRVDSSSSSRTTLTPSPNVEAGQRANVWAVVAFWCGIGSLFLHPFYLTSLAAIIFGCLGIARSGRTGVGRGPSIAGLVLGIVGLVLGGWLFWTYLAWR